MAAPASAAGGPTLSHLKQDTIAHVVQYLRTHDRVSVAATCKYLRAAADTDADALWRESCVYDWGVPVPAGGNARAEWRRTMERYGADVYVCFPRVCALSRRLEAYLESKFPEARSSLRPGATRKMVEDFEEEQELALPAPVKAWFMLHDGQDVVSYDAETGAAGQPYTSARWLGLIPTAIVYDNILGGALLSLESSGALREILGQQMPMWPGAMPIASPSIMHGSRFWLDTESGFVYSSSGAPRWLRAAGRATPEEAADPSAPVQSWQERLAFYREKDALDASSRSGAAADAAAERMEVDVAPRVFLPRRPVIHDGPVDPADITRHVKEIEREADDESYDEWHMIRWLEELVDRFESGYYGIRKAPDGTIVPMPRHIVDRNPGWKYLCKYPEFGATTSHVRHCTTAPLVLIMLHVIGGPSES